MNRYKDTCVYSNKTVFTLIHILFVYLYRYVEILYVCENTSAWMNFHKTLSRSLSLSVSLSLSLSLNLSFSVSLSVCMHTPVHLYIYIYTYIHIYIHIDR